ncbi:MAG TPA: hypothetical protein VMF03_21175 [Steroidobacteraceae bacterium]|nr:hypothetical protein [Steroidobacteraceae bacterium]
MTMNSEPSTGVADGELGRVLEEAMQRAFTDASNVRAAEKLSQIHRATGTRFALWSFGIVSMCSLVPAVLTWMLMPSRAQVIQARQNLDQLSAGIASLSREGGRIDLRRCGETNRLCVRVDRKAPFYGPKADFAVVKGY